MKDIYVPSKDFFELFDTEFKDTCRDCKFFNEDILCNKTKDFEKLSCLVVKTAKFILFLRDKFK